MEAADEDKANLIVAGITSMVETLAEQASGTDLAAKFRLEAACYEAIADNCRKKAAICRAAFRA